MTLLLFSNIFLKDKEKLEALAETVQKFMILKKHL